MTHPRQSSSVQYVVNPRSTPKAQLASPLRRSLGLMVLGLGALCATGASAQAFPNKPLRLVVTFPPGGAPDILARLFSEKAQLGFPVVIDNRPGAGGNIGADNVAKSPGDGHTIVMGTVGTHSINGALYEKMPYDMVKDFSPCLLYTSDAADEMD
jgi:tripartite-type tricarboxylate transporter receptor subunit TctC